jgi:hypothetical protein
MRRVPMLCAAILEGVEIPGVGYATALLVDRWRAATSGSGAGL